MAEVEYPMLPVPEALALVLAQAAPLPAVRVGPAEALNLVLAEAVYAQEPLPPFPASVKDGYAVVAADGPGVYPLVGEVTAGRMAAFTLRPGSVAYITTGAPLPPGADAVVMVEETERLAVDGAAQVRIRRGVQPGDDVRPVGRDVAQGQQVLAAGTRLGAAEIGLLATVGAMQAAVVPRPRWRSFRAGMSWSSRTSARCGPEIRDSNRAMLAAAVAAAGGIPVDLGIARDDAAALEARFARGLAEADILLSTGGVSMGDLDLIKPLLARAGTVHFGRLRMKPGKPCTFATTSAPGATGEMRQRLIFGLPGNPVSSLVTFYLLVAPAIRRLAGWPDPYLRRIQAHLAQPLALDAYRPEYHRATARWEPGLNGGGGGYLAISTGSQASSRLLSMRTANVLLELPQGEGELPEGAVVPALVIGDL